MSVLDRADEYYERAKEAADDLRPSLASDLYFKAAEYYRMAGIRYWEKHCEAWGWSQKAKSFEESGRGGVSEVIKYYDLSIQADNSALQHISEEEPDRSVTEGNMRFAEGDKYTALANAEVDKANEERGKRKANHLRKAAEYRLSGGQTMRLAGEISKREGDLENYYNRTGIYHRDRSGYHYYRACAETELGNWEAGYEEYRFAVIEREKAVAYLKKAIKAEHKFFGLGADKSVKRNLKRDKAMLKDLKKEAARAKKEAEDQRRRRKAAAEAGTPNLHIKVNAMEGMVQNLVTTLSVVVGNAGDGVAKNISVELVSPYLEGEKSAAIPRLAPRGNTKIGLSVVPKRAGAPKTELVIRYRDAGGREHVLRDSSVLRVADPEENRPPPMTIYKVKGDLLAEGASKVDIRDSIVQRSNIGKDISVKRGLDESAVREGLREMDERGRRRAEDLRKRQEEIRGDMDRISRKLERHFNRMAKELPYPSDMWKERGSLIMEFNCASCGKSVGTVKDRRWERWIHFGVAGVMVGAGAAVFSAELGVKGLKKLYEDLSGRPFDDLPREELFMTSDEKDAIVERLRRCGITQRLNYCAECGKWVCGECFDEGAGYCNEHLW